MWHVVDAQCLNIAFTFSSPTKSLRGYKMFPPPLCFPLPWRWAPGTSGGTQPFAGVGEENTYKIEATALSQDVIFRSILDSSYAMGQMGTGFTSGK